MLINDIKINKNHIIGVLDLNKKNLLNLYEYCNNDFTVLDEINKILSKKNYNQELKNKKTEELLKMLNLKETFLNRKIRTLSTSEIIKLYFSIKLFNNENIIIIEDFFKYLDNRNKNKIFKILINLKKYHNKTIFIYTNDLNETYEILDDIIYINNDNIVYDNKYDIFKYNIDNKPEIINFTDKLKKKYKNIEYKDSINELIKELYRELR